MNKEEKIEQFVDWLLDEIIHNPDPVLNYQDIRKYRSDLLDNLELDIKSVDKIEIIDLLNKSKHRHLYQNVNLYDLANVVFIEKLNDISHKVGVQQMLMGISEQKNIDGLFNIDEHDEFNKMTHGIKLSKVEKYFKKLSDHQTFELRGNIATFIEYYYHTKEGEAFIDSYKKIKDPAERDKFFDKLIEKMNDASLVENIKKVNGVYEYTAGSGGDMDGFFIVIDDDFNMTFNVSSTKSDSMTIETDTILRHAVVSKFISEAIAEAIDDEVNQNSLHISHYDADYLIKKDRADTWNTYVKNNSKNSFIYKSLKSHIERVGLDIKVNYNDDDANNGKALSEMIKELNKLDSAFLVNKVLKEKGTITEEKIDVYFETRQNFNTHFISKTPDVQGKSPFLKSTLKDNMDSLNVKMTDFRAFLQINSLKEGFLSLNLDTDNITGFSKKAVECFFNKILVRRIFGKTSQDKINDPNYLKDMESLVINQFILAPNEKIQENIKHLNVHDKKNFYNYLKFILVDKKGSEYIEQKLKDLGINSNYNKFVDKIIENYREIFRETDVLKTLEKISKELDAAEKVMDELRDELTKNGIAIPPHLQKGYKKMDNEIDFDSGKKAVVDLENSVKSTIKNENKPTIKKKLN